MLKVAQVHVVRHLVRVLKHSERQVARELGISRNTVRRYLDDGVVPGTRVEAEQRPRPVRDRVEARAFELLEAARTTRKQRMTSPRLRELLAAEGLLVSERSAGRMLREWKRRRAETFVPLEYRPGDLAEVDFFEVTIVVGGVQQTAWMFLMRLMYSGRDFAWLYRWQDQACFFDGHVRALSHFGRVPQRILYDNLKPAVRRVLVGSERELNPRFNALAAHYAYEPRFARPGEGHDKGGVESRGRAIRLQHLTPLPEAASLDAISQALVARLDDQMQRPRRRGETTVAALWAEEVDQMLPPPLLPFEASILHDAPVDRQARVRVRNAWYSVPSKWSGLVVRAFVHADRVVLVHKGERSEHVRQPGNGRSIWYPHYLDELRRKPQALEQVADTLTRQLGDPFDRLWRALVDERGRRQAARCFVTVVTSIQDRGQEQTARAISRAMEGGEDPVLSLRPPEPTPTVSHLPAALAGVVVPATSLLMYDQLLGGRS